MARELVIASLFWDANDESFPFSRMYDESWVEKLYRGFERNLTVPWRFVLYTDRERQYKHPIEQVMLDSLKPGYADCIQPYEMDKAMILVGLDTVVTGNCDELADWCLSGKPLALPRDPFAPHRSCNGVALVPDGKKSIYDWHQGENDMDWLRAQPHVFIDDVLPGQVKSYKGYVRQEGLSDERIVYFHGEEKPHQLENVEWVRKHWS